MCCRRGHRRAPVVVVLGKLAYDKYQERKARNLPANRERSPSPEILETQANGEILEKAGLSPPSYNDLVGNHAIVPEPVVNVNEKAIASTKEADGREDDRDDLSDAESFYDVADGMRTPSADFTAAQSAFVKNWKAREDPRVQAASQGGQSTCQDKCRQKKAEKAVRKAEKAARKAEKAMSELRV